LKVEGEACAHHGDSNRAPISAGMAESVKQFHVARRCFGVIKGGDSVGASRGFYSRSGLARGLVFRWNRMAVRDAVFGSVSYSR
jgi:hypothetical protein